MNERTERRNEFGIRIIETIIERNEGLNEHGAKIINELVKIETACTKEYVWYQTIGDHKHIVCSYKAEKRMRKAMADYGFYKI